MSRESVQSYTERQLMEHLDYNLLRRKLIECVFGWGKQHGTLRKTKHRGLAQVASEFLLNIIAYNLIRIAKLITA